MKKLSPLIQAGIALTFLCVTSLSRAEVTLQYLSNPEAKKTADKIVADLLNTPPPGQPSGFDGNISMDKPTPAMLKFTAAHGERLVMLDHAASLGQPSAMMLKCYMGSDAMSPQWIINEGIAWCAILANETPASMGAVRETAQRALDDFKKNNRGISSTPNQQMMSLLHSRIAHPELPGPIQSVDPILVVKPDMKGEDLARFTLFQLGQDFSNYINANDLDRAIFLQKFAGLAPGTTIKLVDYANFATALSYDKTLTRHPQQTH